MVAGLTWTVLTAITVGSCSANDPGSHVGSSRRATTSVVTASTSLSTASATDPSAKAARAALAAYRGFRAAQVKAEASGIMEGSGLQNYAFDNAEAYVGGAILLFRHEGVVMRGRPVLHPHVEDVNLTSSPSTVSIQDCFDTSAWEAVFADSGKSAVAPNQARRIVVDALVEVHGGRWKVRNITNHRDRTC